MISSKRGRLYLRFFLALALLALSVSSYLVLAAVPSSTPVITNTNGTTVNGVLVANASVARASDKLFGYANFTSENGTTEENSTFKWFKRTLYQPQNRVTSEVGL